MLSFKYSLLIILSVLLGVAQSQADECKPSIEIHGQGKGSAEVILSGPCNLEKVQFELADQSTKQIPDTNPIPIDCKQGAIELVPKKDGKCYFMMKTTKTVPAGLTTINLSLNLGSLGELAMNQTARIRVNLSVNQGNEAVVDIKGFKILGGDIPSIEYSAQGLKKDKVKEKSKGLELRYYNARADMVQK